MGFLWMCTCWALSPMHKNLRVDEICASEIMILSRISIWSSSSKIHVPLHFFEKSVRALLNKIENHLREIEQWFFYWEVDQTNPDTFRDFQIRGGYFWDIFFNSKFKNISQRTFLTIFAMIWTFWDSSRKYPKNIPPPYKISKV